MSGTFELSLGNHWIASLMRRVMRAWYRVKPTSHITAFLMLYHTAIWCRERNLEGIRMHLDFQTTLPNEFLHGACAESGVSTLPKSKSWDAVHNSLSLQTAFHPLPIAGKRAPESLQWPTDFQVINSISESFSSLSDTWLCETLFLRLCPTLTLWSYTALICWYICEMLVSTTPWCSFVSTTPWCSSEFRMLCSSGWT